jgi:hypothetical protein
MIGPVTIYAKVIICSLTVNATTTIIDGLNHPVNRSDELPEPTAHQWATHQPLPSRGFIYEDTFSALYGTPTGLVVKSSSTQSTVDNPIPLTLLESEMLNYGNFARSNLYRPPIQMLQWLEANLMRITSISYACLGEYFGYQHIAACVRTFFINTVNLSLNGILVERSDRVVGIQSPPLLLFRSLSSVPD